MIKIKNYIYIISYNFMVDILYILNKKNREIKKKENEN